MAEEALSRLGFISDCLGAVKGSPWVTGAWNCPLDQAEVGQDESRVVGGEMGHPFFISRTEIFLFNFERRIIHVFPHNFLINKDRMLGMMRMEDNSQSFLNNSYF